MSLFKNRKRSGMVLTGVVLSSGVVSAVNQGVAGAVPQNAAVGSANTVLNNSNVSTVLKGMGVILFFAVAYFLCAMVKKYFSEETKNNKTDLNVSKDIYDLNGGKEETKEEIQNIKGLNNNSAEDDNEKDEKKEKEKKIKEEEEEKERIKKEKEQKVVAIMYAADMDKEMLEELNGCFGFFTDEDVSIQGGRVDVMTDGKKGFFCICYDKDGEKVEFASPCSEQLLEYLLKNGGYENVKKESSKNSVIDANKNEESSEK